MTDRHTVTHRTISQATQLEPPNTDSTAKLPDPASRFPVIVVAAPHPAVLPPDALLSQCDLRTQPRGGPGGQHRNRTSSGAFLLHTPSQIVGEATERRSQAVNRGIALQRLRYRLAIELRSPSIVDIAAIDTESSLRKRYRGHALRMNDENVDKPAVLALLLNDLHACAGQPSLVAPRWRVSSSRIVALLKSHPPAFLFVNQIRQHHSHPPLK